MGTAALGRLIETAASAPAETLFAAAVSAARDLTGAAASWLVDRSGTVLGAVGERSDHAAVEVDVCGRATLGVAPSAALAADARHTLDTVAGVVALGLRRCEAEDRYRCLADSSIFGVLRAAPDGTLVFANDTAAQLLGYDTPEELLAVGTAEALTPRPIRAALMKSIRSHGAAIGAEYEQARRDGSMVWVKADFRAVVDARGSVLAYEAIFVDVTERKRVEERYRIISELASDYAYTIRIEDDGSVVSEWMSEGANRDHDATPEWLMAEGGPFSVLHPEDLGVASESFSRLLAGEHTTLEVRLRNPDGEYVWMQLVTRPMADAEGRVVKLIGTARDITERKHTAMALQESEDRYRQISDLMSDYAAVFDFGSDGRILLRWATASAGRDFGYTQEEFNAAGGLIELVHEADRAAIADALGRLVRGMDVEVEVRLRRKDGQWRWVRMLSRAAPHDDGLRLIGAGHDITEQRRSEAAALASEARLRHLVADAPVVIYSRSPDDWRTTFITESVVRELGYEPDTVLLDRFFWRDRVHPDDMKRVCDEGELAQREGHGAIEYRFRHADGSWIWLHDEMRFMRDDDGAIVDCVGSVIDITARKEAEEEAAERTALLELLVQQMPAVFWVTDRDLRISLVLGNISKEMSDPFIGRQLVDVAPRLLVEQSLPTHEAALSGRTGRFEAELMSRNWSVTVAPLRDTDGQIVGTIGLSLDVTPMKKAQGQLAASLDALREADRERHDLMSRLVTIHEEERSRVARELHDHLGQILTSAALFAKPLEDDLEPGSPLHRRLSALRGLVEKAMAATRTLVWSLRPLELSNADLVAALHRLAADVGERHGLHVDVHTGSVSRLPATIETAVYRVIQEALTNVVKHAEASAVSVMLARRNGIVSAIVEDDGRGFDQGEVEQRRGSARGIGLLSMRERASGLGGELLIESTNGSGTTVRLEIPLDGSS